MLRVQDTYRSAVEFVKEAWQELRKVHWPSQKETYAATAVVVILVLIMVLFLALVDYGLTKVFEVIIR